VIRKTYIIILLDCASKMNETDYKFTINTSQIKLALFLQILFVYTDKSRLRNRDLLFLLQN